VKSGGNNFNDFRENVATSEIKTKIEKTFLVFSSVAVGLFLEWAQCCSISSTHLNPAHVGFSALTLLVGRQEGHPACKKTEQ